MILEPQKKVFFICIARCHFQYGINQVVVFICEDDFVDVQENKHSVCPNSLVTIDKRMVFDKSIP